MHVQMGLKLSCTFAVLTMILALKHHHLNPHKPLTALNSLLALQESEKLSKWESSEDGKAAHQSVAINDQEQKLAELKQKILSKKRELKRELYSEIAGLQTKIDKTSKALKAGLEIEIATIAKKALQKQKELQNQGADNERTRGVGTSQNKTSVRSLSASQKSCPRQSNNRTVPIVLYLYGHLRSFEDQCGRKLQEAICECSECSFFAVVVTRWGNLFPSCVRFC